VYHNDGTFSIGDLPAGDLNVLIVGGETASTIREIRNVSVTSEDTTIVPVKNQSRFSTFLYPDTVIAEASLTKAIHGFPLPVRFDTSTFDFSEADPDAGGLRVEHFANEDSVVVRIRQITGWDTATVSVGLTEKCMHSHRRLDVVRHYDRTFLFSIHPEPADNHLFVTRPDGKTVQRLCFDKSGLCRWNSSATAEGVYFVGARTTGWVQILVK